MYENIHRRFQETEMLERNLSEYPQADANALMELEGGNMNPNPRRTQDIQGIQGGAQVSTRTGKKSFATKRSMPSQSSLEKSPHERA